MLFFVSLFFFFLTCFRSIAFCPQNSQPALLNCSPFFFHRLMCCFCYICCGLYCVVLCMGSPTTTILTISTQPHARRLKRLTQRDEREKTRENKIETLIWYKAFAHTCSIGSLFSIEMFSIARARVVFHTNNSNNNNKYVYFCVEGKLLKRHATTCSCVNFDIVLFCLFCFIPFASLSTVLSSATQFYFDIAACFFVSPHFIIDFLPMVLIVLHLMWWDGWFCFGRRLMTVLLEANATLFWSNDII